MGVVFGRGAMVVFIAVAFHLFGCTAAIPPTVADDAASSPPESLPVADILPPPGSHPWNKEARADLVVGSIGSVIAAVRRMTDQARQERDVVRLTCCRSKLDALHDMELRAHEMRSDIRAALPDDEEAAASSYVQLAGLASQARDIRMEAEQCVGHEESGIYAAQQLSGDEFADNDADGIPDTEDTWESVNGPSDLRTDSLERRVRDLKESVFKAKARSTFLANTVLAGLPPPQLAAATTPVPPASPAAASSPQSPRDTSKLIRTAELTLAVYEVDKNLDRVESSARKLGGYLALRTDRQITVRVPRDKFDELVRIVTRLGDVLHKNIAAEDVTDQYVDLEMRLKNALAVRERLEKLLENATVRDAVEIHRELAKVTEEIERYAGKLKLLRDRIAYSAVTVSFERAQVQPVRSNALLPFPWMNTMGLAPLLRVPR